jgi:hypothetical protein
VALSLVGPSFNAGGNEVAIEELELAYEELVWLAEPGTPKSMSRSRTKRRSRTGRRRASRSAARSGCRSMSFEYRNGNEKESSVRKLTGLARYPDVTLKRGIIGSLDLYSWLNDIRNGDEAAYRTVTVQLMRRPHAGSADVEAVARARSGT